MPKNKYTLPVVDSLKGIGFRFEYSKISDVIPYIKHFIKENFKELQSMYIFEGASYDEKGNIIELGQDKNSGDHEQELAFEPEKDLVAKIERIKSGKIIPKDYLFHVHPIYANNQDVLVKVFTKKLRALYGAKGNLIYRGSRWGLDLTDSIWECFYHKILDNLIFLIRDEGIIPPLGISENYLKIKELLEDSSDLDVKDGSLLGMAADFKNKKDLAYYQGLLMSENFTLKKSAGLVIWKSCLPGPIETTIDQKERTIRHYLGLQTFLVKRAKDSARRNKGVHVNKRTSVINVFKSNRSLSHMKIAEITGVNRKTVGKYINAYMTE